MIRILKAFATAFCGLVTAVATAYVTMAVSRVFDVDFASFSIWFVIPVGAVSVGFLAVSGYYLASLWLHRRPTRMLLVEMLIAAGLAQFLIYYLGYRTQPVGDGHFAYQVVPFSDYLAVMLTKMHLKVNHATFDVGEVGGLRLPAGGHPVRRVSAGRPCALVPVEGARVLSGVLHLHAETGIQAEDIP